MAGRTLAPLVLALLLAGCQSGQQTALMENELRWVEDQYYQLEACLQDKCKELESCRLENQALRQQLAGGSRSGAQRRAVETPRPSSRRTQNGNGDTSPLTQPPTIEGVPSLGEGPPSVLNRPENEGPSDPLAPDAQDSGPSLEQSSPKTFELPGAEALRGAESGACDPLSDAQVTHVVLNRQLTGGYDFDGHAGDEGIMVVAEPRNSAGQFVPLAGGLEIALRDPAAKPGEEEIARWQLDARQAQAKVKRSLLGRGVHLELPWPGVPPEREELTLQVSYTTVDGRTLKVERDIRIDPPRQLSARWTPALDGDGDEPTARPQIIHEPHEAPTIQKATNFEDVGGEVAPWSPYR